MFNVLHCNFSMLSLPKLDVLGLDVALGCNTKFVLQGPFVQSIVSLTSSLRVISLTVLADSIYSILIFCAEKM